MELSPSHVRLIADFMRKATKAANVEAIIALTFKTLKSITNMGEMRIIYSPTPSTWKEWSASAGSMEVRAHDDWPAPLRKALTVFFDPQNQSAGYVSVVAPGNKARAALGL